MPFAQRSYHAYILLVWYYTVGTVFLVLLMNFVDFNSIRKINIFYLISIILFGIETRLIVVDLVKLGLFIKFK